MNGSTTTSTPATALTREEVVRAVDGSCSTAVPVMFFAALGWLVISAVLALMASVKLHSPTIMANCVAFTYGHLRPAANDTFVYGFASQAGLAISLWMLCRLGANRLFGPVAVVIATLFWNFGVALGTVGILRGDTTGFDWLEFPSYGSAIFFSAYVVIAVCAFVTYARRNVAQGYPSQWYILGALLWFPWLYTTARLLLVWYPVRGAMQFLVNGWFTSGLFTLWLGALGVAVLYYFIPKLTVGQVVYSRPLALFGFWTLAAFGPWGGLYRGAPLPSWIVSLTIAGSVLTLLPLIATLMNLWESKRGAAIQCTRMWFCFSLVFLAIYGVATPLVALCPISSLTVVADALQVIALYGFIGFAFFGAIYYIAPRVLQSGGACDTRGKATWLCTTLGILFFSGSLLIGGLVQGRKLMDGSVPFVEVMNSLKPFLRISTLGLLLFVVGNVAIFANVIGMIRQCCCGCADERAPKAKLKPAKAR